MEKICTQCFTLKPLVDFYTDKKSKDKRASMCKACKKQSVREYYALSPEEKVIKKQNRKVRTEEDKKEYSRKYAANKRENKAELNMLINTKARAKSKGLNFNLDIGDIKIPSYCPVLGIPLEIGFKKPTDNSPTLDRIVPVLGYTKGNVMVISHKANRIKNSASVKDLEKILKFLKKKLGMLDD